MLAKLPATNREAEERKSRAADHLYRKDKKVQKVDAQIEQLQKAYDAEITSALKRIKNDYEASRSKRNALNAAYAGQSQRVGSEAGKAAQYNALKREVDTQRQTCTNASGAAERGQHEQFGAGESHPRRGAGRSARRAL